MPKSLKEKTVTSLVWSGVEQFASMGTHFVFGIILARLLTPADYGITGMISVFIAVANCFIRSGFSAALIRKPDRTEADCATVFFFNIVVALVCYTFLFFAAPFIAAFYQMPILTDVTRVIALSLPLGALSVVQNVQLTVRLDFKTQAIVSLSTIVIASSVGIYLAWMGWGVWSLVMMTLTTTSLSTLLLWILVRWHPCTFFSLQSFRVLFGFGSKLLVSSLIDTIYNNIYTIVIGKKFSADDLGLYSRASQFSHLPATTITSVIHRVAFPVLSKMQNDDERLTSAYSKFLRLSAFLIFPLMTGLAALADPLVRFVLTDKWSAAIPLLQVLCFAFMWYPIHFINLNLLQVKGRSDLFLKLEIYKKIVGIITLCVTVPLGLFAMCVGAVVSSQISLLLNTHYTGKLIHLSYGWQMRQLAPTFFHSLVCGAIAHGIQLYPSGLLLKLVLGAAAGATYYLAANSLLKTREWNELLSLIPQKHS